MNRWYGNIGYVETIEIEPGVWIEKETIRTYYGEFVKKSSKFSVSGEINDNKDVLAELSVVADPYSDLHFHSIRYVEYGGTKWKVNTVEPRRPRLILSLGGVYNG